MRKDEILQKTDSIQHIEAIQKNEQTNEKLRDYLNKRDADTKNDIAWFIVRWTFWILAGILLLIPLYNFFLLSQDTSASQLSLEDILQLYFTFAGSVVGFVVGYYFKNQSD